MLVYVEQQSGNVILQGKTLQVEFHARPGGIDWQIGYSFHASRFRVQVPVNKGVIPDELESMLASGGGTDDIAALRNWLAANQGELRNLASAILEAQKRFKDATGGGDHLRHMRRIN